mmetsp:Transcript_127066/g.220152  ORF Transcript_127066/g.220152 Transcript_127066/m.220152 type:complete len:360 (-) Transcript_127066:205-1284(-)
MSGVLSRNSLEHAAAGTAGSVLATCLLFPLERLKTLSQLEDGAGSGLRDVCMRVLQDEGIMGFYRGCWPMLQTVGVSNFLYFFLFEGLKEPLAIAAGQPEGEVGPYETLLSSAIAGSLNMCLTEPLWRACIVVQARSRALSSRLRAMSSEFPPKSPKSPAGAGDVAAGVSSTPWERQITPLNKGRRNSNVFGMVAHISVAEGPRSLWRGLGSSLWLVVNPVIQFWVYDVLKAMRRSAVDVSSLEAFCMGAVAKAIATIATFPLQVAQSRLRAARDRGTDVDVRRPELQGMVPCLRAIVKESGFAGLFSGLLPKLLQTVTQAACMFAFYEKIHWAIRRYSRRHLRMTRRMRAMRRALRSQ